MKRILSFTLILSILLSSLGFTAVATGDPRGAAKFTDITDTHWTYPFVDRLTKDGTISGVTDTTYAPTRDIHAAEFITLVLRSALGFSANSTAKHWAEGYMNKAFELGITTPEETPFERWSEPIKRQEMAKIITRSMELIFNEAPVENAEDFINRIADWEDACTPCKPYILQAYAKGILVGVDDAGTFAGTKSTTRGEAACVVVKLIDRSYRTDWEQEDALTNTDGTMKMKHAEQYIMETLENTRFYKENGKYYISCTYPELPDGFEMFFSFGMERTNGPIILYKTNAYLPDSLIPNTGSFVRELPGLSSPNEIVSIIMGISVEAPNATINDYRKCEGSLGLQAEFKNGSIWLWDVYIAYTAGGSKQATYDQNKLFQW